MAGINKAEGKVRNLMVTPVVVVQEEMSWRISKNLMLEPAIGGVRSSIPAEN